MLQQKTFLPLKQKQAHTKHKVPSNAISLTCTVSALLSLINIGSADAFNAIISLGSVSLFATYVISESCVLHHRMVSPETLPKRRWSLEVWGLPVNVLAVAYSVFGFFWCFWPNAVPVTAENFDYSSVLFVGVIGFSLVTCAVSGRKHFRGPVLSIRRNE